MNQKAISIPTVSLSINAHKGARQSSNAVSHRRSCALDDVESDANRMNAIPTKRNFLRIEIEQAGNVLKLFSASDARTPCKAIKTECK
jgi:hypothetical protein